MVSYGMVWYGNLIWLRSYPRIRKRTTHDVMSTARRDPTFGVWARSAASKMSRSCTTHLWDSVWILVFLQPSVHWNTAWQQSATYCQDGITKEHRNNFTPSFWFIFAKHISCDPHSQKNAGKRVTCADQNGPPELTFAYALMEHFTPHRFNSLGSTFSLHGWLGAPEIVCTCLFLCMFLLWCCVTWTWV